MTCLPSLKLAFPQASALFLLLWLGLPGNSTAQTTSPAPVAQTEAAPPQGQAGESTPANNQAGGRPDGLYLDGLSLAPFSRARLGRPLTILAQVRNKSAVPRTVVGVAKINAAPDFQAATVVDIPPYEQRAVELRLQVPPTISQTAVEVSVSVNDPANPTQVLLSPSQTPLFEELRIPLADDWFVTALVMKTPDPPLPDWYWPQKDLDMEFEWMAAARADSSQSKRALTIDHDNLPTLVADWQGIDQIVISNERPFHDPAVMGAMNRWIAGGGRAWIMLDQIDPTHLRKMLSDGMSCEMLDDIELNRFVVESTASSRLSQEDRTVEVDQALRFRRVLQTGGEVTLSIDGFPMAVWYRIGKGLILVTTVAPEGWVVPRTTARKPNEAYTTFFQLRNWAIPMADRLYEFRQINSPIEAAEIQYPMQQIGNPVLDRRYVLAIVFGFCGLLCALAGICWRTNRMMRLAWLIPGTSVIASAPLIVSSAFQRRDIPDTSAHLQLIEVQPGSQSIQALQWTASYMSQTDRAKLLGDGDAMVTWPRGANQLDLRRWNWTDYGKWELSSSGWPNGLWQLQMRYALPKSDLDVIARLDDTGLHIELPPALKQPLQDAVFQFSAGNPAPCGTLEGKDAITIPERHLSEIDSWLTDSIVSDEQRRREQVYRQLHATGNQVGYPSYPAVMGWTQLWPGPITWNENRDERGAALVVLPVKLLPVAMGQRVHVPHNVVQVRNASNDGAFSTAFSNASGWWRGPTTLPSKVGLRCTLPAQVCPLQADEMTCHIQMRAPQRKVSLSVVSASGQTRLIQEFESPTAVQTVRIVEPELLQELRDGTMDFELDVGPEITEGVSPFGDQQANWQVDYFRLSANGQVGSATAPGIAPAVRK